MVLRSITKSVAINRDPADVFRFLADASNWPRWAIVNVLSVAPAGEGWWDMRTPGGPAKLRIRAVEAYGLLDHDFVAPEARWTVPARVVPNAGGAEFLITFFQPPPFTDEFFDHQVALVDKELAQLKEILEQPAEPGAAPDPARK
jgi:uncharacterized protein YndB with AHSA1/START domain